MLKVCDLEFVKWAWSSRLLACQEPAEKYRLISANSPPQPGDAALVRVQKVGHHRHLETERDRRLRLYRGDLLVGIFGNRYATDVYEGRVTDLKRLHILTASGLLGTVLSRHHDVGLPTSVSFVGFLTDLSGHRINLKELRYHEPAHRAEIPDVLLVVGTGMNSGKTTVVRQILRGLSARGVRVAGCKLTGSASPRDLYEMQATGAVFATDFSDYGFPSTYGEPLPELLRLAWSMFEACGHAGARLIVAEIADGLLQPETQMLLDCEELRRDVRAIALAANCSSSLLFANDYLRSRGYDVWVASGLVTNSPLYMREFSLRSSVPVVPSRGSASRLASIILEKIGLRTLLEGESKLAEHVQ